MDELLKQLIALGVGGILGGGLKAYLDYKSEVVKNVWNKRLEAYMKFVQITGLFPIYARRDVHWKDIVKLSMDFRDWYFEGYGLVVSTDFRNDYFALQKYISAAIKEQTDFDKPLTGEEYDDFRSRCSKLRTLMATELESRQKPIWQRLFSKKTKPEA